MHFVFQLFLEFEPTRLAARGLSDIHPDLIPGTIAIYPTIRGLCSHSQTHYDLNQFPSVTLTYNSLVLTVFLIRTLPQKVIS